jgi:hypothetical protein
MMDRYLFQVTEPARGTFVIEWNVVLVNVGPHFLEKYGPLAGFLYWAELYDAAYRVEQPILLSRRLVQARKPQFELQAVDGTWGEYTRHLYGRSDGIFRICTAGTHKLVQHGLDGLPKDYMDRLQRDMDSPIFRIEPRQGGVYIATLDDWWRMMREPGQTLADLAISRET